MDAPKHFDCMVKGSTGQYYRIAGTTKFKCKTCSDIAYAVSFDPEAFTWKDAPDKWATWAKQFVDKDGIKHLKKVVKDAKLAKEAKL